MYSLRTQPRSHRKSWIAVNGVVVLLKSECNLSNICHLIFVVFRTMDSGTISIEQPNECTRTMHSTHTAMVIATMMMLISLLAKFKRLQHSTGERVRSLRACELCKFNWNGASARDSSGKKCNNNSTRVEVVFARTLQLYRAVNCVQLTLTRPHAILYISEMMWMENHNNAAAKQKIRSTHWNAEWECHAGDVGLGRGLSARITIECSGHWERIVMTRIRKTKY